MLPSRAALLTTLVLAGCSVVNAPGEHRHPLSPTEFCQEYGEILCQSYLECCPEGERTPITLDECVPIAANQCASDFGALAIDPRTGYDPDAAARVVAEARALVDGCSLDLADWVVRRTGFSSMLEGTIAAGERCDVPSPPTLMDPAPLFSCTSTQRTCLLSGAVWQCSARRGAGEPCVITADCQDDLYCTALVGGTCQPRQPDGTACLTDDPCASHACVGLMCAPRTAITVYCGMMPMM